ncbi:MAG: hypothetical protein WA885_11875 [Phormidesmis sp.]
MKYLSAVLFATLVLGGCSGSDSPIAETPSTVETTDAETSAASADELAVTDETKDDASGDEAAAADEAESDTEGVEQKNVKLKINNQETAGQIVVKTVSTARDGWVSIHQSKEDGSILLPDSIGEARVDSGDSEGIVVDLWEAPYVGEKLWVLLHVDSGDRGIYEFPEKDAPVRKSGEMMARSFVIKGEAPEEDEEKAE